VKIELTGYTSILPGLVVYPACVVEGFGWRVVWSWVPSRHWRWPIRFCSIRRTDLEGL
jgi:hypothetical protein